MNVFFECKNVGVIASHGSGEAIYNVFCIVGDSSRLSSGFSRLFCSLPAIFMAHGNTIPKSAKSIRAFIRTAT